MKQYAWMVALLAGVAVAQAQDQGGGKPPRGGGQGAGGPGAGGPPPLEKMDKDGDGKVSIQEFIALPVERAGMRFGNIDANSDSKVTKEEWDHAEANRPKPPEGQGHAAPTFDEMDTNKDGSVTKEEVTAQATARITERAKELDKNSDGFITQDELPARTGGQQGGQRGQGGRSGQGQGGPGGHGQHRQGPPADGAQK